MGVSRSFAAFACSRLLSASSARMEKMQKCVNDKHPVIMTNQNQMAQTDHSYQQSWICDFCDKTHTNATENFYRCQSCMLDICMECHSKQRRNNAIAPHQVVIAKPIGM